MGHFPVFTGSLIVCEGGHACTGIHVLGATDGKDRRERMPDLIRMNAMLDMYDGLVHLQMCVSCSCSPAVACVCVCVCMQAARGHVHRWP